MIRFVNDDLVRYTSTPGRRAYRLLPSRLVNAAVGPLRAPGSEEARVLLAERG